MAWTESAAGLPDDAIVLVGPTASGKSDVALCLAEEIGADIVSADSVQVYRGMDIGTAKPDAHDRARIPHWMIDLVDVSEAYDVARYCRDARAAIAAIADRGARSLVVGGSGLYVRALIQGLADLPAADPVIRSRLESEARAHGADALYDRLRQVDPVAASRTEPTNLRRLVRALEVFEQTGRPISAQQSQWDQPAGGRIFGLQRERADIVSRIDARTDRMLKAGWVDEVRVLLDRGIRENASAAGAVGYRELIGFLDGERSFDEVREGIRAATRALARRQLTWLRHQLSVQWVAIPATAGPEETARQILQSLQRP